MGALWLVKVMPRLVSTSLSLLAGLVGAGALSCALAAAPPHLVSSAPAKDSHVEWPKQVHLQFSGPLQPASVSVSMIRPDGESIPMAAPAPSSADDRAFTAEVKQPTQAGPYMVQWQGRTPAGALAKGDYTFFVQ
jgi:methionine-rich copper-binding protein CopC